MSREYTATCEIIVCGVPRKVCVVFEVESFGSADGYFEPGDPASIVINDVRNDDEDGRSIYDFCEEVRDIWAAPRNVEVIWRFSHGGPWCGAPAYCHIGFNYHSGAFFSLLDTLYEMVLTDHMPEYEPSDDDICLGSVYYLDTRGEYDV